MQPIEVRDGEPAQPGARHETHGGEPSPRPRRTVDHDLLHQVTRRVRPSFWSGWGGTLTTLVMAAFVVALLVGWVFLWVQRPGGPNIPLLTLGCIAFTLLLVLLATLQNRIHAHWRLRQAEAIYLAGVSHNLRTPISAIRAAAQALAHTDPTQGGHAELISSIIAETRRLGLRVDNVLESGRLEVERLAFESHPVSLTRMVEAIAEETRAVTRYRGGTFTLRAEPEVWVDGDTRALRLLLDNLVDNALKYSRGTPQLEVRLFSRDAFALVQVMDQGFGCDPEEVRRWMRRARRFDRRRAGTGLGLPLARAIARGHGGDLHLYSEGKDRGATAELWLPLAE